MAVERLYSQEECAALLRASRQRRGVNLQGLFLQRWTEVCPELLPEHEYHFQRPRQQRFDFAWPAQKVAVEIEGGSFVKGRHTQPEGFQRDCRKYNAAQLQGWMVLRYTSNDIQRGMADVIAQVYEALLGRGI